MKLRFIPMILAFVVLGLSTQPTYAAGGDGPSLWPLTSKLSDRRGPG